MRLSHLFLPHPDTHKKAHLISWYALVVYILLFISLQSGFNLIRRVSPGILGVNSTITPAAIVSLTNQERQKVGLLPLSENPKLDAAAKAKAENMLAENYWAHFSPSGKDPWGFIKSSNYQFTYAGENLAKNFYTSSDTVSAWMASPSHKENIVNNHYQEIGVAVVEGSLMGQQTTLVVQMFGTPTQALAGIPAPLPAPKELPVTLGARAPKAGPLFNTGLGELIIDPYAVTKTAAILLMVFVAILLSLDLITLKKRGVFRFSSHHFAHFSFLTLSGLMVISSRAGEIL